MGEEDLGARRLGPGPLDSLSHETASFGLHNVEMRTLEIFLVGPLGSRRLVSRSLAE